MKLLVGLGNPEPEYSWSRHNIGKEVINIFAKDAIGGEDNTWGINLKLNAELIRLSGAASSEDIILAKPLVQMNESGEAVRKILNYFKINPSDLLIIYDELDLTVGNFKLNLNGSLIHNGIRSINQFIKSPYWHLRVGVRDESIPGSVQKTGRDPAKYVLSRFDAADRKKISKLVINSIVPAINSWLSKN